MFALVPKAERNPPFLKARTEVLGAIDRVENRDPSLLRRGCCTFEKTLLADQAKPRQMLIKQGGDPPFQEQIGFGHGAPVRLPAYVIPATKKRRERLFDEAADISQQRRHRACHAARSICRWWASIRSSPAFRRSREKGRSTRSRISAAETVAGSMMSCRT